MHGKSWRQGDACTSGMSEASSSEFVADNDAVSRKKTIAWDKTADTAETHGRLMVASFSFLGEVSGKGDS
jgi:hypothetical protein